MAGAAARDHGPAADYAPVAGAADELIGPDGRVREAWLPLLDRLGALSEAEAQARFARGDRYLRDAGVFYRQYGAEGSTERAWPLSHVPVLIDHAEWEAIADALIQRAELLELVAADLYGPARLVAEGHLPASLIAASPAWLRPLVGHPPATGHHLHFVAFEIGRGPDGQWWVLGDRTEAPMGAGFALENRVATARVFPDVISALGAARLDGFFAAFRARLDALRRSPEGRIALLTPGMHTEAWFEHAYIARYLGLILLEGEDLRVTGDRVEVRTVDGLKPVDALWRRMDAPFADPLELDERSAIGTPGLAGAARAGGVAMLNSLGAGVLETRALLAFLPRLSERLLGEALKMPNIATWWCGQPEARAAVHDAVDRMMIGPALSTRPLFERDRSTVLGESFREAARERIAAFLEAEGPRLVGQEAVKLSTTPAWVEGQLVPRPATLRLFLARTAEGWQVMPGGYARIGRSEDPSALSLQEGGSVADVWVVGGPPAKRAAPAAEARYHRPAPGVLPARAADNLYWLGRYVARAEGIMRLLRAFHARLEEARAPEDALLGAMAAHLAPFEVDPMDVTLGGLRGTLARAVTSAGHVRDRFSVDGWHALDDLEARAGAIVREIGPGDETARAMSQLLRMNAGFSGLVSDNMYRFTGWRFLRLGRAVERAHGMAAILARFADPGAPDGALDLSVELGDSTMTHLRRYALRTNRATVVDLLALDALNPRAILSQLELMRGLAARLPGAGIEGQLSPLSAALLTLCTDLSVSTPDTLDSVALSAIGDRIAAASNLLHETYLS